MMEKQKSIYKMIICAIFSALAFVGTMIQIPLPSGGMIHLGNFVVIISALLCGPYVGGLAGGLGCGLYELLVRSNPIGFIQYFLLKLIMGLIVGHLFRKIVNNKIKLNYSILLIILGSIMCIFTSLVIIFYNNNLVNLSSSINNKLLYIILVSIAGYLFSIIFIFAGIFSNKLNILTRLVMFVTTISVFVNLCLEFMWKLLYNRFVEDLSFNGALIKGISSIPSCILTGCITVGISSLIYYRVYLSTKDLNKLNDIEIGEFIDEE